MLAACIEWVDNVPRVVGREIITKTALGTLPAVAASLPFKPRYDLDGNIFPEDEELVGLTCAEAANIQQARKASYGDLDSQNYIMDRSVGKPKQTVESKSMTMTYQDYLDSLPPPPDPEEDIERTQMLLSLNTDDASPIQTMKLRKMHYQQQADDL